jgi:hypothetical protein
MPDWSPEYVGVLVPAFVSDVVPDVVPDPPDTPPWIPNAPLSICIPFEFLSRYPNHHHIERLPAAYRVTP